MTDSRKNIVTACAMVLISAMALLWLSPVCASAAVSRTDGTPVDADGDSITVSLLTCWPGPEVYELCGHEAIRIRGAGVDSVWNYGVFDFAQPDFIYRFVKGETDYMLLGYPFPWFFDEYHARRSKVVEQDLNLTQEEARALRRMLQTESLPQNRFYRYNYVKDNCATRIVARMDSAFGPVSYPDGVRYGTFRNAMRHYHSSYPWYQFGIDLALGSGLDYRLSGREEMFAPIDMMGKVAEARLPDGRPLVRETRVVNQGIPDATLPPTPWWLGPLFWMSVLCVLCVGVAVAEFVVKDIFRWVYTLFYTVVGCVGVVVTFLVFFSTHEATSPNILIILFNPVQFLFAACVWWRRSVAVASVMAVYNIVAVGGMMLMWPLQPQVANVAFFPIMGASLALAIPYAIITLRKSYKYMDRFAPQRGKIRARKK